MKTTSPLRLKPLSRQSAKRPLARAPQVIYTGGKPAFAVIPWNEYRRIAGAQAADGSRSERSLTDEALWDRAAEIDDGTRIPLEVTKRIMAGESPIKVYRDWRGMTQKQLARAAGIASPVYLSQIETKRRKGSADVLRRIARALNVDMDDVVV